MPELRLRDGEEAHEPAGAVAAESGVAVDSTEADLRPDLDSAQHIDSERKCSQSP